MRRRFLIALVLLAPIGLATKAYAGPAEGWVRSQAGGVLYVLFWILAAKAVRPALPDRPVAAAVLAVTCGLEALQLWHPPPLEAARATFLGAALLGTTFSWWDLPHYAAGAVAGLWLARRLAPPPGAGVVGSEPDVARSQRSSTGVGEDAR